MLTPAGCPWAIQSSVSLVELLSCLYRIAVRGQALHPGKPFGPVAIFLYEVPVYCNNNLPFCKSIDGQSPAETSCPRGWKNVVCPDIVITHCHRRIRPDINDT